VPRTSLPNIGSLSTASRLRGASDFGIHVNATTTGAVVAVRGEFDGAMVPTMRTMLDGVVDTGYERIVLDLDGVTFIDAAGLGAIVATRIRQRMTGGSLVLRSVPPPVSRLLAITALNASFEIEVTDPDDTLRSDLARAATLPARNQAIDAQLSMVIGAAQVTIDGADGISVTFERNGVASTVAATNDTVLRMDAHQYSTGEGPCLSAAQEGLTFHIESLADEARWPAFVPLASGQGIASILSTPLVAAGMSIGALNVYSNTEGAFADDQRDLVGVFADHVARILANDDASTSDDEMSARISDALRSRLVLAQAQGVLMGRHHMTADDATNMLHRMARAAESSVLEHATVVVASTQDVGPVEARGHG